MDNNEIQKENRGICEKKCIGFIERGFNTFESLKEIEITLRKLSKSFGVIKFVKLIK